MLNNAKALAYILVIAGVVFWLARRACPGFMAEGDFKRRRNLWFGLTIVSFLSPSIWLVLLIAVPVLVWAGRKDPQPAALFMALMFVFPAFELEIPKILKLSPTHLLAMCIALPALIAPRKLTLPISGSSRPSPPDRLCIVLLLAFCILQEVLYLQIFSWTEVTRRIISQIIAVLLPFLLVSRTVDDRKSVLEVIAAYVLSCSLMAAIGVFESLRGWLLYAELANSWDAGVNPFGFLLRDGQLRAMAATGHSLGLGFLLAVAFALCVYLRRYPQTRREYSVACLLMWAGMFAAFSRGAWLTAVFMMLVYFWLMPGGAGRVVKSALLLIGLSAVVLQTPFGERIYRSLPFIGSVDSENVTYRQRLLARSLELIPQNPWFGDLYVTDNMQSLVQGQGIVDIVNGYLFIALHFGLVTLSALLLFVFTAIFRMWLASSRIRRIDADLSAAGSVLIAVMLGHLLFMWLAGIIGTMYLWAALGLAYSGVVARATSSLQTGGPKHPPA